MLVIIAAAAVAKHSIARSLCVLNEESSLNAAVFTPRLNSGRVITASCYLSVVGLYGFVRERGLRRVCALASARPIDKSSSYPCEPRLRGVLRWQPDTASK